MHAVCVSMCLYVYLVGLCLRAYAGACVSVSVSVSVACVHGLCVCTRVHAWHTCVKRAYAYVCCAGAKEARFVLTFVTLVTLMYWYIYTKGKGWALVRMQPALGESASISVEPRSWEHYRE